MGRENLIGRDREISELQRSFDSDRSEFVIVYGRRRVGKTYLVDNFFNYEYDHYIYVHKSMYFQILHHYEDNLHNHKICKVLYHFYFRYFR